MRRTILFPLISLSMIACTDGTFLHSYKPLPAEGWDIRDTITFDIPQVQEDLDATLYIGLRTKTNIGIRDIMLAVEQSNEDAIVWRCDTVRYPLTDAEGNALNKGVNMHQYETLQIPCYLKKGKQGTIRIHHLMSNEVLTGITEVGIKIEETR